MSNEWFLQPDIPIIEGIIYTRYLFTLSKAM